MKFSTFIDVRPRPRKGRERRLAPLASVLRPASVDLPPLPRPEPSAAALGSADIVAKVGNGQGFVSPVASD